MRGGNARILQYNLSSCRCEIFHVQKYRHVNGRRGGVILEVAQVHVPGLDQGVKIQHVVHFYEDEVSCSTPVVAAADSLMSLPVDTVSAYAPPSEGCRFQPREKC